MKIRDRITELRHIRAGDLLPNPRNWRTHPEAQSAALAASLDEVGIAGALIGYETPDGIQLIDGHLRQEQDPDQEWPVLVLDVDEAEADKLLATLDPLAAMAGADAGVLDDLLKSIETDSDELQKMLDDLAKDNPLPTPEIVEDEVPEPPAEPITQPGDLWILGEHRLLCGDSTKAEDVAVVMDGEKTGLLFTSPPYWVGKEYENETTWSEVQDFIRRCALSWSPVCSHRIVINTGAPQAAHLTGKRAHIRLLLDDWQREFEKGGLLLRYARIWTKTGGLCHTRPESDCVDQHWEFVGMFYRPETYEGQRRCGESWATNGIWDDIPSTRQTDHPAPFHIELPCRNIRLHSDIGGSVLDPFLGSGTTLIAAEQLGRRCYGLEISPAYCDVVVNRWQNLTGKTATRQALEAIA